MRRFCFSVSDIAASLGVGLIVFGCGGGSKVLSVKSDPADAEVCLKGKANSEYFTNAKTCVGSTPFEADRVEVTGANGEKKEVKFKDLDGNKEGFYVVVSRPGYATQSFEVPAWDHFVALKPEGTPTATAPVPAAMTPEKAAEKGVVKITSDPNGVLVYIDGALQGNTPFTYQSMGGPVKMKLEMEGYRGMEKVLTVVPGRALNLNFKMMSDQQAEIEQAKAKPVQTAPIKVKDAPAQEDRTPATKTQ